MQTGLKVRTAVFGTCALAAALAHSDVLAMLYAYSRANASASHVVLVPLVCVALVLQRRREIFARPQTNWHWGFGIVLAGIVLGIWVRLTQPVSANSDGLALLVAPLVVTWVGAFLLVFGSNALWAARFAAVFLVFTVPVPTVLLDGFTELLKRGSTAAVSALFTLTGTPFHREGFVFSLATLAIEIADECSGVRSSVALLLTSLLAGHMYLKTGWKKGVLALAIFPISVFKNGVRIVSLSLLATHVDPSFLVGRLHHDGGVAFFLLALAMLLPVLQILRRSEPIRTDGGRVSDRTSDVATA